MKDVKTMTKEEAKKFARYNPYKPLTHKDLNGGYIYSDEATNIKDNNGTIHLMSMIFQRDGWYPYTGKFGKVNVDLPHVQLLSKKTGCLLLQAKLALNKADGDFEVAEKLVMAIKDIPVS